MQAMYEVNLGVIGADFNANVLLNEDSSGNL
jgi:hypothetical protein